MVFDKGTSNIISIRMPVDNNKFEFKGYFTVCNGCILWRAKKVLPKFYSRQPLGNPTYSSPNMATLAPANRVCQFGLMVCARGSPKYLDFTRNTPRLNQLCQR